MTTITATPFGKTADGIPVTRYTFRNASGSEISVLSYGGTIASIRVPDREGRLADVVLGYDDLADYQSRKYFFGASIGRSGNRIGRGRFTLGGRTYQLNCNEGNNHLHGGFKGFDTRVWNCAVKPGPQGDALELTLTSPDGDENYPGRLDVTMAYTFDDDNALTLRYRAVSDADTLCNLTNHSYFNLAGHDSGDILGHELRLAAGRYTATDRESIPTGATPEVAGTPMDFRDFHVVGERVDADFEQLKFAGGYDHNWILDKPKGEAGPCAEVYEPVGGRTLTCTTTSPCVQFYCGNFIDGTQAGKGGCVYHKRAGLCLETQFAPDAVNHPSWDSPVLRAGALYDQTTVYRFGVR